MQVCRPSNRLWQCFAARRSNRAAKRIAPQSVHFSSFRRKQNENGGVDCRSSSHTGSLAFGVKRENLRTCERPFCETQLPLASTISSATVATGLAPTVEGRQGMATDERWIAAQVGRPGRVRSQWERRAYWCASHADKPGRCRSLYVFETVAIRCKAASARCALFAHPRPLGCLVYGVTTLRVLILCSLYGLAYAAITAFCPQNHICKWRVPFERAQGGPPRSTSSWNLLEA